MSNEQRSLLNSNFILEENEEAVVAIVREERGNKLHVFLLTDQYAGGSKFYTRYEFDGQSFSLSEHTYASNGAYFELREILNNTNVVGQCWQVGSNRLSRLYNEFDKQRLAYRALTGKGEPLMNEQRLLSWFHQSNNQESCDEYTQIFAKTPFEWAKFMLGKMKVDEANNTLPNSIEAISGKIPDLSPQYLESRKNNCYYILAPNYEIAVDELKRINVAEPLNNAVSKLAAKRGLFSIGVRQKVNMIKETVSTCAATIVSEPKGIQETIKALNTPRVNCLTFLFWYIFKKGKLTASCEHFLIELVKQGAASLVIKDSSLHLNFNNNWLRADVDVGVPLANLSTELISNMHMR